MNRSEIADTLEAAASRLSSLPVVTGFDGFVDEMTSLVAERQSLDTFRRVETITEFSELTAAAAGHSSLREIVVKQADPGGCAINMGDGMASLGLPVTTFATVGDPVDAAFADYAAKATLHSWGRQPGRTTAFEFADGKLMFSAVSQLAEFTPQYIAERLREGTFRKACAEAKLIALTDWSMYPHMTDCWSFLQEEVFSALPQAVPFFIDLVDPSSRAETDIARMLKVLPGFEKAGPVTLGLNQNEANVLSRVLRLEGPHATGPEEAASQAAALREALGLHCVVIHGVRYAALDSADGRAAGEGPYCAQPVKSTGAGDRFNAAYAFGQLLDLTPLPRLQLGMAGSGSYVRLARSATLPELAGFLRRWESGSLDS